MWRRAQDHHHGFVIMPTSVASPAHTAEFTHRLPFWQICKKRIGGV